MMSENRTRRTYLPALLIVLGGALPLLATVGPWGDFAAFVWCASLVLILGGAASAAHVHQRNRAAAPEA